MNIELIKFAIKNRSAWLLDLSIIFITILIISVLVKTLNRECGIAVLIITITIGILFIYEFILLIKELYYINEWIKPLKELWNNDSDDYWDELYEKMENTENADDEELIDVEDLN